MSNPAAASVCATGSSNPSAPPPGPDDKWAGYYATEPTAAPWDTHTPASQLVAYLCGCPAPAGDGAAGLAGEAGSDEEERCKEPAAALQANAATAVGTVGSAGSVGGAGAAVSGARDSSSNPGGGFATAAAEARVHMYAACAALKPWPLCTAASEGGAAGVGALPGTDQREPSPVQPPRALELCCGTGASLAFLHGVGFSVVGVELVATAAGLAAQRISAARGGAAVPVCAIAQQTPGGGHVAPTEQGAAAPNDGTARERAEGGALPPSTAPAYAPTAGPHDLFPAAPHATPTAVVLQGDLFAAQLPAAEFDFAYDCQGLHAMPAQLRHAYVRVLHRALRRGGLALLLVGRREQRVTLGSSDVEQAAPEAAAGAKTGAAACVGGEKRASGPSLLALHELRELLPPSDWHWCWCRRTRYDMTPAYERLPQAPPAWSVLVRRL